LERKVRGSGCAGPSGSVIDGALVYVPEFCLSWWLWGDPGFLFGNYGALVCWTAEVALLWGEGVLGGVRGSLGRALLD
jgi:hypothetical protein